MPATKGRSGGNRWLKSDRSEKDGKPERPNGMPQSWNEKWDEVVGQLEAICSDDLRTIDVHLLRHLVTLLCHEVELSLMLVKDPSDQKNRRLYLGTVQSISRLSSLFGLSPRDRKALDVQPAKQPDDADQWSDE